MMRWKKTKAPLSGAAKYSTEPMKMQWRRTKDGYVAESDGNHWSLFRDPVGGWWRCRVEARKISMDLEKNWPTPEKAMWAAEIMAKNMHYERLIWQEEKEYIQVIRCPDGWQVIDVDRRSGYVISLGRPFLNRQSARENIDDLAYQSWTDKHLRGEA